MMRSLELDGPRIPWAVRVLEGPLVKAHRGLAEDDAMTLAPLPGATVGAVGLGGEYAQSGACCPSGSCCASGSCCESGSACVQLDEDTRRPARAARFHSDQKRLWPIPV